MSDAQDETMRSTIRRNLAKQLGSSGLLEYECPTPTCGTQIFTTWKVDLTCNHCGQKVESVYDLEKSWLK